MTEQRTCPTCGNRITGHPNKRFCGKRCKDRYHNEHNPRGYGAVRERCLDDLVGDLSDDPGWDAHK